MLHLKDEQATSALGARLAGGLRPGHVVLLHGDLGAGKSALARATIQATLGEDVPVPSPTFTLIQEYAHADFRIVHTDLYRLSDPEEIEELGLDAAFDDAAVLVEWPDRLGEYLPLDRLDVSLSIAADGGRDAVMRATGPRGHSMLEAAMRSRDDLISDFMSRAGWAGARHSSLAGDASNRRYLRVQRGTVSGVLMDAPAEKGEDVRPFIAVTETLRARGLSAPEIFAHDAAQGFLLLEDLGDGLYARLCAQDITSERPIYEAAIDVLAGLRAADSDPVPPYDAATLEREAALLVDWWLPAASGKAVSPDLRAEYLGLMAEATADVAADRSALVLRDFHAENLIWLPDRRGTARVGLLDYQDALCGHPAYDLVSLLEDARRDLSPGLAEAMSARFLALRPDLDAEQFHAAYDALGAQRNAKIIGIFARLCLRDGKAQYVDMIPRVWAHLTRDLASDQMTPLRRFIQAHILSPSPEILARVRG